MGSTALRVAQLGKQSVFATAVAATAKMMGVAEVNGKPDFTNSQKRYLQGDYAPAHNTRITDKRASAAINGDFSFEDFLYVLLSSVKGGVTPTGTTDKLWSFPFPLTASPAVDIRTIEINDGTQEYDIVGAVVSDWALAGAASNDGLVTFSSNWVGRDFVPDTLTPALSNRTFETLPVGAMNLYIDDLGGTIGSTAKTGTLIDFNLTYSTGIHMKKFAGDGDVRPTLFGYNMPTVGLSVTYESNATAHAEIAKYALGTGRLIRLDGAGSGNKKLRIDFAGDIMSVDPLYGDRDGNTTVKMTLAARLDIGAFANYGKIEITNLAATAP
jgi:hypothetical protein